MTQRSSTGIADLRTDRRLARPAIAAGALLLAFAALGCTESMRQAFSGPPDTPEELLAALRTDRSRIDQTTDSMMRKIDTYNQSRKGGERTIQFSEVFMEDLTGEQRDVLNELLTKEQDVSYKSLLQKMIADRDSIKDLQQKVLQLEQRLPDTFVVAKKGDKHSDLAMNYLTNDAHLEQAKAKDLLSKVDRSDELVAGNHVWFFYDPNQDTFRTYITQGEAGQTPLAVRRAKQRQLIAERDTLKVERDTEHTAREAAETEVASLEQRKTQLESDISLLQQNKADLESNVDRLSKDLAFRQNSLFYHAEASRSLKDKGVLSGVLARVKDVKGVTYDEALDLRQATSINLDPNLFGLEKIHDVRLLPSIYQEGRDYSVTMSEETGTARLMILDPDLFR
ncbi:MAG TPA: hypothetical protein VJV75_13905, partial [Candidatus Polarisedimenticolia bacterium]|nr:hypothetical protein [Candidatus Polarisedimenticolia bacterium]